MLLSESKPAKRAPRVIRIRGGRQSTIIIPKPLAERRETTDNEETSTHPYTCRF